MMTPQLTEQYGHVERVSLARAIFSVRSCAYAGFRSKPNSAAAAPPTVLIFRKSRRVGLILTTPIRREGREGSIPRRLRHKSWVATCQASFRAIRIAPGARAV